MFDVDDKTWASLSKEKQEQIIERRINEYYANRDDIFIAEGINDTKKTQKKQDR